MNEETIEMTMLETNEEGRLTVSTKVATKLQEIDNQIKALNDEESFIRHQILDEMVANNIDRCSSCGLTFTQVIPKAKGVFDTDNFLLNESEDVIKCFTNFEENEEFDIEKFKIENHELYEKYTKKNIVPIVDTKKLQKTLEPVFKKYYSETSSDKLPTLRITTKKGE